MNKGEFITSRMLFCNSIFIMMLSLVIFYSLDMTSPTNSYARNDTNKIKDKTKSAGSLHAEGLRLYNEGKYEEAIEVWLEEIEITPKNANTYNNIGIAYYFLEDYESAVPYHKRAIEINKNFGHGYYSLGRAYVSLGKNEEAIQVISKAIELKYSPYDSYYLLGTVYKSLKEYEEARDSLLKSLESKKHPITYYLLGDVYFDLKDYKQAKDAYLEALEINNENLDLAKLYHSIGLVNEKLGDSKEAKIAYRKAQEIERQRQMSKELDKYQTIFNNIVFICGLIITFFISMGSISPLRMYFRTGMKSLLFMGVGGILSGIGLFGIILNALGGYFDFLEWPIILLVLLIIVGAPFMAIGSMILNTKESGFYVELGEKTTFKQRLTGNIPILKFEKPPPPAMSKRTGLIFGIITITLGGLLILLHILFKIPGFTILFVIPGTFALITGLLLVIFSIIYLDNGKKSPEEKLKI